MELKNCFNIILKLTFLRSFLKVLSWRACAALRHQCSWLEATACMASRSLGLSCRVAVFGLGGFQCLNSTSFLSKWQGGGWHGWHRWHECSGKGGQRENWKVQFRAKTLKTFQTCLSLIETKKQNQHNKNISPTYFFYRVFLHFFHFTYLHYFKLKSTALSLSRFSEVNWWRPCMLRLSSRHVTYLLRAADDEDLPWHAGGAGSATDAVSGSEDPSTGELRESLVSVELRCLSVKVVLLLWVVVCCELSGICFFCQSWFFPSF